MAASFWRVSFALRTHRDARRCAGHEFSETLAQKEPRPMRTRLDCWHRDVQTLRDFGHRQAVDIVEEDHGSVVIGQLRDRRGDRETDLGVTGRVVYGRGP